MIPARIALWVAYGPTFLHSRDFLAVQVLCWELVKDTLSLLGTKYLEVRFSIFQPRTQGLSSPKVLMNVCTSA
jgi:hypothetical protein